MNEVKKVSAAEYIQSTPTISLNPLQETVTEDIHCSHVHPFPLDMFPQWLQKAIRDHSASYRTPEELWACAFLSGISAAAGKRFKLITGNYENYPQLWLMVVGSSGTGKSEAFRVAFRRLNEIDTISYAKYQLDYQDWEEQGKPGTPPRWDQTCIGDTTPEALFNALGHSESGLTLYRDELSGWFKDIGRYNQSGEVGHYLSIFDNNQFSINRKGDRPQLISEPFLNIFGTIQPGILQDVLSRNGAEESGFAQRFLYLYPEFPVREYQEVNKPGLRDYNELMDKLSGITDKTETSLSEEAVEVYKEFYNRMERERAHANDFWAAVYSKAQIQVLRLALTVKIARLPEVPTDEVEKEDMECAIGMMNYFIHSLKKFKGEQSDEKKTPADVIRDIYKVNPSVSQRTVAAAVGCSQPYVQKIMKLSGYQLSLTGNLMWERESCKFQ